MIKLSSLVYVSQGVVTEAALFLFSHAFLSGGAHLVLA